MDVWACIMTLPLQTKQQSIPILKPFVPDNSTALLLMGRTWQVFRCRLCCSRRGLQADISGSMTTAYSLFLDQKALHAFGIKTFVNAYNCFGWAYKTDLDIHGPSLNPVRHQSEVRPHGALSWWHTAAALIQTYRKREARIQPLLSGESRNKSQLQVNILIFRLECWPLGCLSTVTGRLTQGENQNSFPKVPGHFSFPKLLGQLGYLDTFAPAAHLTV